jgi:hypothetical protein
MNLGLTCIHVYTGSGWCEHVCEERWIQLTDSLFIFLFSLKSIDLVCMKKLDTKVNIIPIIAKADTISKTELQKFKVYVIN